MSHNAFDSPADPPRRFPSSGEPSGWRAFDSGGQVAAPVSPPRSRPRNPYGGSESGGWTGQLMDAPPTAEVPSLWPPVSEPSAPRVGAGLRPYSEPVTNEAPALRPGTRFREPSTAENMTVGQRPPSPYREYATGETATVTPQPRRSPEVPQPRRSFREPAPSDRPAPRPHSAPFDEAPAWQRDPARDGFAPPDIAATTAIDRQPTTPPDRFGPAATAPGGADMMYREPPTAEAATLPPGSAPPFPYPASPPRSAPPFDDGAGWQRDPARDGFAPPDIAATTAIDRQPTAPPDRFGPVTTSGVEHQRRPEPAPPSDRFGPPGPAATTVIERHDPAAMPRPDSAPPFGYESSQRPIQVEPDTGSMTDVQLAHAPADPPWQSRRAAEEDASFISASRVLGTVGVIVVIIAIAGAVIWGLNLYGDRF